MNTFLLNTWFHIGILMVSLFAIARWTIASSGAYRGFALGVLTSLLIVVMYGAVNPFVTFNMSPLTHRLSLFHVIIAVGMGLACAGGLLTLAWVFTNNVIEREFRATILVMLITLSAFFIFVSTAELSVMIILFVLTCEIMLLGAYVAMRGVASLQGAGGDVPQATANNMATSLRDSITAMREQITPQNNQSNYPSNYRI